MSSVPPHKHTKAIELKWEGWMDRQMKHERPCNLGTVETLDDRWVQDLNDPEG